MWGPRRAGKLNRCDWHSPHWRVHRHGPLIACHATYEGGREQDAEDTAALLRQAKNNLTGGESMGSDEILGQLSEGTVLEEPYWTEPVKVLTAK